MSLPTSDRIEKQDRYFEWSRPEMLEYIPPNVKRVLDVGCATGAFSADIKARFGAEVWGVELNPAAAAKAEMKLDRVICSAYDSSIDFGNALFDCIVFNDVLEHMQYPESALRLSLDLLAPAGVVVASIPNVRHLSVVWDLAVKGEWEYKEAGILDGTHFRFFTESSIRGMFRRAGYSVLRCEGINEAIGRKFRLLNLLFAGKMNGLRHMQYAVVAARGD